MARQKQKSARQSKFVGGDADAKALLGCLKRGTRPTANRQLAIEDYVENLLAVRPVQNRGFYRPENYDKIEDLGNGRQLWAGANDWEAGWTWAWITSDQAAHGEPLAFTEIDHSECPGCHGDPSEMPTRDERECIAYGKQRVAQWAEKQWDKESTENLGWAQPADLWETRIGWDPDYTWLTENEWAESLADQLPLCTLNAWDPDKHPRGPDGRFLTGDAKTAALAGKAPKNAQDFLSKVGVAVKPARSKSPATAHTVASLHKEIKSLRERGDVRAHEVASVASKIATLKVKDIKELKAKLGTTASGPKRDMANSLALKVLASGAAAPAKDIGKAAPMPSAAQTTAPAAAPTAAAPVVLKPAAPIASPDSFGDRISAIIEREKSGRAPFSDIVVAALKANNSAHDKTPAPAFFKDLQRVADGKAPLHNPIRQDEIAKALKQMEPDFGKIKPSELLRMLPHMRFPEQVHGLDIQSQLAQRRIPHDILKRIGA